MINEWMNECSGKESKSQRRYYNDYLRWQNIFQRTICVQQHPVLKYQMPLFVYNIQKKIQHMSKPKWLLKKTIHVCICMFTNNSDHALSKYFLRADLLPGVIALQMLNRQWPLLHGTSISRREEHIKHS